VVVVGAADAGRVREMFGVTGGDKPMPAPKPGRFTLYASVAGAVLTLRWAVRKYRFLPTVLVLSLTAQALALVGVPSYVLFARWRNSKRTDVRLETLYQREPVNLPRLPSMWGALSFTFFFCLFLLICYTVDELDAWLVAAALQCFAFAVLIARLCASRSVAGISAGKLELDSLSAFCRVFAAWLMASKLPRKAGNNVARSAELTTLLLAFLLLYCIRAPLRHTYQADTDRFDARKLALVVFGLAIPFHVDIAHAFIPDVVWTAALYVDAVAMLPQLAMTAQNGGVVDEAMSHHVAFVFLSRMFGLAFWWLVKGHWAGGLQVTGFIIMGAYGAQLLLLSHFMCYYLKARVTCGIVLSGPLVCAEG